MYVLEACLAPTHRRPSEGCGPSRLSVKNERRDRLQPALERRGVSLETGAGQAGAAFSAFAALHHPKALAGRFRPPVAAHGPTKKAAHFCTAFFMSIMLEVYRLPTLTRALAEYAILFVADKTEFRDAAALNGDQCLINGVIWRRWCWLELKLRLRVH